MAITLRTALYETAQRVVEKKKLETESHRKLVEEYLEGLCVKAAEAGMLSAIIPTHIYPFEDGTVLTDDEIKVFAQDYDLDYTPREGLYPPVLSFGKH